MTGHRGIWIVLDCASFVSIVLIKGDERCINDGQKRRYFIALVVSE